MGTTRSRARRSERLRPAEIAEGGLSIDSGYCLTAYLNLICPALGEDLHTRAALERKLRTRSLESLIHGGERGSSRAHKTLPVTVHPPPPLPATLPHLSSATSQPAIHLVPRLENSPAHEDRAYTQSTLS